MSTAPINIPIELIPLDLVFVREVAKGNNPKVLERKDFTDVLQQFNFSIDETHEGFAFDFFVCGNFLNSRQAVTIEKDSPRNLGFYRVCAEAPLNFVKSLTLNPDQLEKGDVNKLARLFG